MRYRQNLFYSCRGSILPLLTVISLIIMVMLFSMSQMFTFRAQRTSTTWARYITKEAARSSFVLVEAAMKRRLWEAPADENCMKRLSFSASGKTREGVGFNLDATLDPKNNILQLVSVATYGGSGNKQVQMKFQKNIKINDISKYLLLSKTTNKTTVDAGYGSNAPTTIIANDRKLYFEGPVTLGPHKKGRANPSSFSSPIPMRLPNELAIILQAERFYFLKGLSYAHVKNFEPEPNATITTAVYDQLNPLSASGRDVTSPDAYGAAYITQNYTTASNLYQGVVTGVPALPSVATLAPNIYPISLVSGPSPMNANLMSDTGVYIPSPNLWYPVGYDFKGDPTIGKNADYTCYTDMAIPVDQRKYCSDSDSFPKGFSNWRTAAGLDGIVLASQEASLLDFPTINWDNYEALEDDAKSCGYIVDPKTSGTYVAPAITDCDLSDKNLITEHINAPTVNYCPRSYRLDIENLHASKLNNLTLATYADNSKKDLFLRRIIYFKSHTNPIYKSNLLITQTN